MGDVVELKAFKRNKRKMPVIIAICVVLVALIVVAYVNRYRPFMQKIFGKLYNTELKMRNDGIIFDNNVAYQFGIYKGNLVLLSSDTLKCVNNNGETIWETSLILNNPTLQITNKYILCYDRKGKECYVVTNNEAVNHITTEHSILCAKMNNNGYFAVATSDLSSLGLVTVYNNKGDEVFKWYSGNNYILDVDISPDNSRLAVCTMNVETGSVQSGVTFFKMSEEKPYAGKLSTDTLFSNIIYNENGTLTAIGNNKAVCFSKSAKEKWSFDYLGGSLDTYAFSDNSYAFAIKNAKNTVSDSVITVVSSRGKNMGTFEIDGDVTSIDYKNGIVCASKGRDINMLSSSANLISSASLGRDVNKVFVMSKKQMLVIGSSGADLYDAK